MFKDHCEFYVYYNDKKYPVLVDFEDLQKLIKLNSKWIIFKHGDLFYVRTNHYGHDENGKYKLLETILLHRFLLNCTKGDNTIIDHVNHDGLDNRRNNLRIVSKAQNDLYRKSRNSNNKSGYRNVFWNTGAGKWEVSLSKNYKRVYCEQFDDVDEAGAAAQEARLKYYGEYAGNN